jgi:hypothetical protein
LTFGAAVRIGLERPRRCGRQPRATNVETKIWNEGGQRFTYEGRCIRTLKKGQLKMAYGDERLREIRRQREPVVSASPGLLRRVIFGFLPRPATEH